MVFAELIPFITDILELAFFIVIFLTCLSIMPCSKWIYMLPCTVTFFFVFSHNTYSGWLLKLYTKVDSNNFYVSCMQVHNYFLIGFF